MDSSGVYRDQFTSLVGAVPLADGKKVRVCVCVFVFVCVFVLGITM